MSRGRATQTKLNILAGLTLAAAIALGLSLTIIWTVFSPWIYVLLGIVILLGIVSVFAHRCPQCGHDVTRNAQGVRTHKSWPKASETCAGCGADIP